MNLAVAAGPTAAVLLDRDGVINHERRDYVRRWEEFAFLPGALAALRILAEIGLPVVVVTNQSAIGRGLVEAAVVEDIHRRMLARVRAEGGRIDAVLVCPHEPGAGCSCRKPLPGLFHEAARRLNLALGRSFYVGDSLTDFQVAREVGCRPILVRTGLQGDELRALLPPQPDVLVNDLAAAARVIAGQVQTGSARPPTRPEPPGGT